MNTCAKIAQLVDASGICIVVHGVYNHYDEPEDVFSISGDQNCFASLTN